MSDAILEAKARRAKLQQEIELIDRYLDLHRQIFGGEVTESVTVGDLVEAEVVPAASRTKALPQNDPAAIAHEVEGLLAVASEPMTRGELRNALASLGVAIHSKDASKYLGTVLWRNRHRFINIEGRGYWLKNRELPPWLMENDPLFQ